MTATLPYTAGKLRDDLLNIRAAMNHLHLVWKETVGRADHLDEGVRLIAAAYEAVGERLCQADHSAKAVTIPAKDLAQLRHFLCGVADDLGRVDDSLRVEVPSQVFPMPGANAPGVQREFERFDRIYRDFDREALADFIDLLAAQEIQPGDGKPRGMRNEAWAMHGLMAHPEWQHLDEVAEFCGVILTSTYRWPKFMRAWTLHLARAKPC